jgi:hypothetical protein
MVFSFQNFTTDRKLVRRVRRGVSRDRQSTGPLQRAGARKARSPGRYRRKEE